MWFARFFLSSRAHFFFEDARACGSGDRKVWAYAAPRRNFNLVEKNRMWRAGFPFRFAEGSRYARLPNHPAPFYGGRRSWPNTITGVRRVLCVALTSPHDARSIHDVRFSRYCLWACAPDDEFFRGDRLNFNLRVGRGGSGEPKKCNSPKKNRAASCIFFVGRSWEIFHDTTQTEKKGRFENPKTSHTMENALYYSQ
jgi:hypothetical protein